MARLLINIDVPDLEHGIAFYTRAFGLKLARRLGEDFAELTGGEAPIYVLQKPEGSTTDPSKHQRRSYLRHWTPLHLDFAVDDIERSLARALDAGAVQEGPIETHPYGKLVLLADPFGHGVCFLQLNARGYDAIATKR